MSTSSAPRRNAIRALVTGIALLSGPASALPVRSATFFEAAYACVSGAQVDGALGADDLLPESISIVGSGFYGFGNYAYSWDGTATTSGAPSPRATAQATNVNIGGACLPAVRALVTYDVEVVGAPGAPSASVRVIFSAIGEIAVSGNVVGFIRALVRGVDPVTGNAGGAALWDVSRQSTTYLSGQSQTILLNDSRTAFLRGGDIVRVSLDANCRSEYGSCSATIDPLPVIDPNQLIFVDGLDRPATDFFSLAFSSNIPEPATGGLAALGIGMLLYLRRATRAR